MPAGNKSDRLGQEKISKLLIKLSLPAIAGMIIQSLYNIIDSIYIGNLGTEYLSALSLAFLVQLIIIALGVGTGIGASSLISRLLDYYVYWGHNEYNIRSIIDIWNMDISRNGSRRSCNCYYNCKNSWRNIHS